jgi:hypothetical protein
MAVTSNSSALAKLYTYVRSLIESCEVIPTAGVLPSFSELKKSPDRFYELFSEATYKYNIICDTLQKLQHANAMLVKVLNDLMNPECRESYNTKNQYIKNFTNSKTECYALISGYETAKASAESIVKYFNSAQYVITSNRFDAVSASY